MPVEVGSGLAGAGVEAEESGIGAWAVGTGSGAGFDSGRGVDTGVTGLADGGVPADIPGAAEPDWPDGVASVGGSS